jgi:hypothetical protein
MTNLNGAISVKRGRPLVNMFLNISSLMGWRKSCSLTKAIIHFCNAAYKVQKEQSIKGLVIQLKTCSIILQQSMGGYRLENMGLLGTRIARNGRGLPRKWIPLIHRKALLRGDPKVFKLYMTLFGLFRVLNFPGKLSWKTIITPGSGDFYLTEFRSFLTIFQKLLLFHVKEGLFYQVLDGSINYLELLKKLRAVPFIISKASPSVSKLDIDSESSLSTSPAGILWAMKVWHLPENLTVKSHLFEWCKMTGNIWLINRFNLWNESIPTTMFIDTQAGSLGKLGTKEEAAGKIRVFAMIDPWTQWLMEPLFQCIAAVLRQIPQDGTENQQGPLDRLWKRKPQGPFYCFDLSAATDRLPLSFQQALLSIFLGNRGGLLWGLLLVSRPYLLKDQSGKEHNLYYKVGQPMGAKSSFHMMALFHHAIIQWAFYRVCQSKNTVASWFEDYCIVGDDIVISHDAVAEEYLRIMAQLGVGVGIHKSLISSQKGRLVTEFIKKTWYSPKKGIVHDVSAVPISEWWVARQMLSASVEFARKYSLSLSQFLDLWGVGFRVKARLNANLQTISRRTRGRILAYFSPLGVQVNSFTKWVSLKATKASYKTTMKKQLLLIESLIKEDLADVLKKWDKPLFKEHLATIKRFVEVRRDREYYGTSPRRKDRIHEFIDLELYQNDVIYGFKRFVTLNERGDGINYNIEFTSKSQAEKHMKMVNNIQFVLDQLVELVYREGFLDVIIDFRDLRNEIEEFMLIDHSATEETLSKMIELSDEIFLKVKSLEDRFSELPLPTRIYKRVEELVTVKEPQLVRRWDKYSKILRSTKS